MSCSAYGTHKSATSSTYNKNVKEKETRLATWERLARAVREKGKDEVEHSADDDLCVICQDTTVDAVEVSALEVYNP